ncbi:hypothetical protein [Blastopirellula marina]|uniref:Uncharacterized protein n=1 Tax=Blastopirellula marina DSM 3645 TaxID=314230 RepID=A3ZS53_9BACT|nr:hypothetical protein [Blastopirellula marina]EAQ80511.1 hypothetical protein DSM3645_14235 [Blastopirellula marina DSM 3645]
MFRRPDPFELYHLGLGAVCAAALLLGCAPPPNQVPVDPAPPTIDSTADPAPLEEESKAKIDIDIGGGQGVDIDVDGRTDNPAN